MIVTLLTLAATLQPPPHWFVLDRPNGASTYLWGTKDDRGYIRGTIPPAGAPELLRVPKLAPMPELKPAPESHRHILNYGVDLNHRHPLHPQSGEVRGTDPDLGREIAKSLVRKPFPMTGQCPGPGPCPSPRRPVKPVAPPVEIDLPGIRYGPLAAAAGLFALTVLVVGCFILLVAIARRRYP